MSDGTGAGDRWIPEQQYQQICSSVPIVCVDLLPLLPDGASFGLIERDTYDGRRGLNLVGGSVLIDETLVEALQRHVRTTLGPNARLELDTVSFVGTYQYFRDRRPGELHDPRKNAVSLTYAGVVGGDVRAEGEALAFHTFDLATPPPLDRFGFGQGVVVYDGLQQDPADRPHLLQPRPAHWSV